jgi:hypothetical protein
VTAGRIVQEDFTVVESFHHEKVIEVPENDEGRAYNAQLLESLTETSGRETIALRGLNDIPRVAAVARDPALPAERRQGNNASIVGEDHG